MVPGQFYLELTAAAFCFWLLAVLLVYQRHRYAGGKTLTVLVQDQAEEMEGFVRQLVRNNPGHHLVLIDTGSSDQTAEILKRMMPVFGFALSEHKKGGCPHEGMCCDVRGLKGKQLVNLDLFKQLSL